MKRWLKITCLTIFGLSSFSLQSPPQKATPQSPNNVGSEIPITNLTQVDLSQLFQIKFKLIYYLDNSGMYQPLIAKLRTLCIDSTFEKKLDGGFLAQVDPWISAIPTKLESQPSPVLQIITSELIKRKNERLEYADSIKQGHLYSLLPKEQRLRFERDKKALIQKKANAKIQIGSDYNITLKVLHTLRPYLQNLITNSELSATTVNHAYLKSSAEEQLILLYKELTNSASSQLSKYLFNNQRELASLKDALNQLTALTTITTTVQDQVRKGEYKAAQKELEEQQRNLNENYNNLRASILKLIDANLNYLNTLDEAYKLATGKGLTKSEIISLANAYHINQSPIIDHDTTYLDIIPRNGKQAITLRLRFNAGALGMINSNKVSELKTKAAMSLIYASNEEGTHKIDFNDPHFKDLNQQQQKAAAEAIKNPIVEIPLGITISDIVISKTTTPTNAFKLLDSKGRSNYKISLTDIGIWARMKEDQAKINAFIKTVNLPGELGPTIANIAIDPLTWNVIFNTRFELDKYFQPIKRFKEFSDTTKITLSEINKQGTSLLVAFRDIYAQKTVNKIQRVINKNLPNLNQIQPGLTALSLEYHKSMIQGKIVFHPDLPWENPELSQIAIPFTIEYQRNRIITRFQKKSIPLEDGIRKLLTTELKKIQSDLSSNKFIAAFTNQLKLLSCQFNPDSKSFKTEVELLGNAGRFPIEIDLKGNWLNKKILLDYVQAKWMWLVTQYLPAELQHISAAELNQLATDQLINQTITIFGYSCTIKKILSYNPIHVEADVNGWRVTLERNGEVFKIVDINQWKSLSAELEKKARNFFDDQDFIKIRDSRFIGDEFSTEIWCQIPALDFDSSIGNLKMNLNGSWNFNGSGVNGLLTSVENKIIDVLNSKLKTLKVLQEGPFTIDNITNVSINGPPSITLLGSANLHNNYKVSGFQIHIDLQSGKVTIKSPDPDNLLKSLKASVFTYLSSTLLPYLLGSDPVKSIVWDELHNGLKITIDLTVLNAITLPASVTITPNKIFVDPRLSVEVPVEVPLAPPFVVLIRPKISVLLEEKQIELASVFTVGASKDAALTALLIAFNAKGYVSYAEGWPSQFGYIGTLNLLTAIPIYQGEGLIDLKKLTAQMSQGTKGPLSSVLKMNTNINVFFASPFGVKANAEFGLLGLVNLNAELAMLIKQSAIALEGNCGIRIPIGSLKGGFNSSLRINDPFDIDLQADVWANGSLKVWIFTLAQSNLKASLKGAYLKFSVLNASLGVWVPSPASLSPDLIIEILKSLLSFDPLAIINILKDPLNISLSLGGKFGQTGEPGAPTSSNGGSKTPISQVDGSGSGGHDLGSGGREGQSPPNTDGVQLQDAVSEMNMFTRPSKFLEDYMYLPKTLKKGWLTHKKDPKVEGNARFYKVHDYVVPPPANLIGNPKEAIFLTRIETLLLQGKGNDYCVVENSSPQYCNTFVGFHPTGLSHTLNLAFKSDKVFMFFATPFCERAFTIPSNRKKISLDSALLKKNWETTTCHNCEVVSLDNNDKSDRPVVLSEYLSNTHSVRVKKPIFKLIPTDQTPLPNLSDSEERIIKKNTSDGDLIFFLNQNRILIVTKRAAFFMEEFMVPKSEEDIANMIHALPEKSWTELDANVINSLMQSTSRKWRNSEGTLEDKVRQLTEDQFQKVKPLLANYLTNRVKFGREPDNALVEITDPEEAQMRLLIQADQVNWTASLMPAGKNKIGSIVIDSASLIKFEDSDLTDKIQIKNTSPQQFKAAFENNDNAIKNLSLTLLATNNNLKESFQTLFYADPRNVMLTLNKKGQIQYLFVTGGKFNSKPDLRQSDQIQFKYDSEIKSTITPAHMMPDEIKSHPEFFKVIYTLLSKPYDTESQILIDQTEDDQMQGFMWNKQHVVLFWETEDKQVQTLITTRTAFNKRVREAMAAQKSGGIGPRMMPSKNVSNISYVGTLMMSGLNDITTWYQKENLKINPFYFFRSE